MKIINKPEDLLNATYTSGSNTVAERIIYDEECEWLYNLYINGGHERVLLPVADEPEYSELCKRHKVLSAEKIITFMNKAPMSIILAADARHAEAQTLLGALVAFNAEPMLVECEEDAEKIYTELTHEEMTHDRADYILTPVDCEEFWDAAEKLNLTDKNSPTKIRVINLFSYQIYICYKDDFVIA